MKIIEPLRKEFRDLIELVLIPGIAIFLPWPLCFRLFRLLSRAPFLYARQTALALEQAQKMGYVVAPGVLPPVPYRDVPMSREAGSQERPTLVLPCTSEDKQKWCAAFRLVQLVDHADLYLSRFRSDRWMDRYLAVSGDSWPNALTPFLAISFHWGTGLWSFRHLSRHGSRAVAVFRGLSKSHAPGNVVATKYTHWRFGEVERAGRAKAIFTGPMVIRSMLQVSQDGACLVALLDAPGADYCIPVQLFGRDAQLPGGITRFAVKKKIPVFAFTLSFDPDTGQRQLMIKGPLPSGSERELMDGLVSVFTEAVRKQSYAWHFWPYLESFLVRDQEVVMSQPSIKNV
ncbi:MAG TPA: hypothetical protein VN418_03910 [Gammaproteobacteria bacterium]|nr:hypothetical protein [Gammaproteobacteria bacterium]